jgi:hypothetical protein
MEHFNTVSCYNACAPDLTSSGWERFGPGIQAEGKRCCTHNLVVFSLTLLRDVCTYCLRSGEEQGWHSACDGSGRQDAAFVKISKCSEGSK